MRRRTFIKTGLLGIFATGLRPSSLWKGLNCDPTQIDILGPYWSDGHPYRTVLANSEEPGTRIFISGTVTANDCETPIENVLVDVWHANNDGCYTVSMECDTGNPEEDPYNLRGIMVTDENGGYAFESIYPGYYTGRPKHFHYKITTPHGTELVTQCYFEDDPRVDDQWLESHPGLVIPLVETEDGLVGIFDIVMNEEVIVGIDNAPDFPQQFNLYPTYPNPFNNSTQIQFNISRPGYVSIGVYDSNGKWVTNIIEKHINSIRTHTLDWNGVDMNGNLVSSGSYLIVMKYAKAIISRKVTFIK